MRVPAALAPLLDIGVIEEVVRPLMSGKEAKVYLVRAEGETCVAKVYKEANNRSFKNRADYTEGRRVRNSRSERAMARRSSFGREEIESAWRSAEVDAMYKLTAAGVRVPKAHLFVEGVLLMELILDAGGLPAPRLADITLNRDEALALHRHLLQEIVRMLCAGVIHGDLSDFNVLMGADGPVIIDFPQAIDPAHNRSARKLLERDVENVTSFLSRFAPELAGRRYGIEMWTLYEKGELTQNSILTGRHAESHRRADVAGLLNEIEDVRREALRMGAAQRVPSTPPSAPLPPCLPAGSTRFPSLPSGPHPHPVETRHLPDGAMNMPSVEIEAPRLPSAATIRCRNRPAP